MNDLDLQLLIDDLIKQLKESGMSREKIYEVMASEIDRACDEQFNDE